MKKSSKIIIIQWMRWSWKSTVGKMLADQLWIDFQDLDDAIEVELWESISSLVERSWRDVFREVEHSVLGKILSWWEHMVLSLGGGTIIQPLNQPLIQSWAEHIIFIDRDIWLIAQWIEETEQRPSLTGRSVQEELFDIYEKRKHIYTSHSTLICPNNGTVQEAVAFIKNHMWNVFWLE